MKISELSSQSAVGGASAANNTYILVNYATSQNPTPETKRISLSELGKAIGYNERFLRYSESQGFVALTMSSSDYGVHYNYLDDTSLKQNRPWLGGSYTHEDGITYYPCYAGIDDYGGLRLCIMRDSTPVSTDFPVLGYSKESESNTLRLLQLGESDTLTTISFTPSAEPSESEPEP